MRALMRRVRSAIISAPRLSPEVWRARLAPSSLAASLGAENSKIQRLDLEKSPENRRRATDSDEVGPTKRIPLANYSLSIALQENALRVMCLSRGRLEAPLVSQGCCRGVLRTDPVKHHASCHLERLVA